MKKSKNTDKWKTQPVKVKQEKVKEVETGIVIDTVKNTSECTKKTRKTMTVGETKLGVTMVISKQRCKELGFKETATTKEVIQDIFKRLGWEK